ncbi:MAG: hypothetical protein ACRCUM_03965 [Mycoplasmoidaceae bacterium]
MSITTIANIVATPEVGDMKNDIMKKSSSVLKKWLERKKAYKISVFEYKGEFYVIGSLGEKSFKTRQEATEYCITMLKTSNNYERKK